MATTVGTMSDYNQSDIPALNLQLVEPKPDPREKRYVPNHLVESKIFTQIKQNEFVCADPSSVHFTDFEINQPCTKTVSLINVSPDVLKLNIIPPQTKYFSISYTKPGRIVPGSTFDCIVELKAPEHRYYYDCIRIHCQNDSNLLIPLHAYPVVDPDQFPKIIQFSDVPVGHEKRKDIPLKCNVPVNFDFQIVVTDPHPAFNISPLKGQIPANGDCSISITYAPSNFSTATCELQFIVAQFNSKPFVCRLIGHSAPGLLTELASGFYQENQQKSQQSEKSQLKSYEHLDPEQVTPLSLHRKRAGKRRTQIRETVVNGVTFPASLNNQHAVNYVLTQEPGKIHVKDLKKLIMNRQGRDSSDKFVQNTRQVKEAIFEQEMIKDAHQERQNKLKWQVKLGGDPVSEEQRKDILIRRARHQAEYSRAIFQPELHEELRRTKTEILFRRTRRKCNAIPDYTPCFNDLQNDPWDIKFEKMWAFLQAARTVIIQQRAQRSIDAIKIAMQYWKAGTTNALLLMNADKNADTKIESAFPLLREETVQKRQFVTYQSPDVKDPMAADSLGMIPFLRVRIEIPIEFHFYALAVPRYHQVLGYEYRDVNLSKRNYVKPGLARPLKIGAVDELMALGLERLAVDDVKKRPIQSAKVTVASMVGGLSEEAETDGSVAQVDDPDRLPIDVRSPEQVTLIKMPDSLISQPTYPDFHVFFPHPELQVHKAPYPYSETDEDHHFCPVPFKEGQPTVEFPASQDAGDIIKPLMTWRRFPSPSLTVLTSQPSLSDVWLPRRSNPFSEDLLSVEPPPLMTPAEATEILQANTTNPNLLGAPAPIDFDTIARHFELGQSRELPQRPGAEKFPKGDKLPSNNPVGTRGLISRADREAQLDEFTARNMNKLNKRIEQGLQSMEKIDRVLFS